MNSKVLLVISFVLLFLGLGAIGGSIFFAVNNYFGLFPLYQETENRSQALSLEEKLDTRDETLKRQERNEKRRLDLLLIQDALENIYNEVNIYPESPTVINLSDSNTDVGRQLIRYLGEIPTDPKAPKYFYGYYCSGGEQYELTAVQETDDGYKIYFMTQKSVVLEEKK